MPEGTCSIEGCEKPAKARGWCAMHYRRWQVHGDPAASLRPGYGTGTRNIMASGYVRVWAPGHPEANADGNALEHRMVAHDAFGPIPSGHQVHHLNHDRTDNRPENLEVKSAAEHTREHLAEQGYVTNQYGTWPLTG